MINRGEVEIMDIDGYDACKILEEIANIYAISQISSDYVYAKVKNILIREKILKECEKEDIPVFMKSSIADIWGGNG